MDTGGNHGERYINREVGQFGEYNAGSVTGWIHPVGNYIDDDGNHIKG